MLYYYWGDIVTIGEYIRIIRKNKGLTQKQLGERANIAEPTIRKYELGKLNPKFETLEKIATALGVSAWELMGMQEIAAPLKQMTKTLKKEDIPEDFEQFIMALGYHFMFQDGLFLVKGDIETPITKEDLKTLVTAFNSTKSILVALLDDLLER